MSPGKCKHAYALRRRACVDSPIARPRTDAICLEIGLESGGGKNEQSTATVAPEHDLLQDGHVNSYI